VVVVMSAPCEHSGIADARQVRWARIALGTLAVALFGLALRLVYINLAMGPDLRARAAAQQESRRDLPARRGAILDTRGRVLAVSRARHGIFADPALIARPDETARRLADVLDMPAGQIENEIRISESPRFCWLKRRVDDTTADMVRALGLSGIGTHPEFERHWPMHETAAQLLGFVGADGIGLEGLEATHDVHLRGTPGRRSVRRDARRNLLGTGDHRIRAPRDGGHLLLTIDSVIQAGVEERLAEQIDAFEAESGVAVVMSPKTGAILALANVPTFDVNRFGAIEGARRRNRAVTDPVEPGSIFKPFVMAGALAGGFARPGELIDCHDGMHRFGGRLLHDTHPQGLLDVRGIIVHSSNIGMATIGLRMGNAELRNLLTGLGFGAATQIGLRGESKGIVPPLRAWNTYSTTSVPMGHEIAVTPVQLATAFSALANGGILLRPRIVRARLAADYRPVARFEEPEIIRRVVSTELANYMVRDVLAAVVEKGGAELDAAPYQMAGKTGTAQVPYADQPGYEPDAYLASFIAAAPVHDPQIVVLAMIRKPNRAIGYYGRVVAGPVVRDVVRATLGYLEVAPGERLARVTP
jgi:cell division protein FtsI (penicillin-binding protein 3)